MAAMVQGFEDLTPIPLQEGRDDIVPIDYPEDYAMLMGTFRSLVAANELSARALSLTAEIIALNPGHYSVWHFRRRCLDALGGPPSEEMKFIDQTVEDNPKNYQIWHHRRALVERHGDGSQELDFVARVLEGDSKNYHAWSHRQWALLAPGLRGVSWSGELAYVDRLLQEDLRNNSAWNHRWFVVHKCGEEVTDEVVARELEYAFKYISRAVNNESPWNYARGFFSSPSGTDSPPPPFARFPQLEAECRAQEGAEGGRECQHRANLLAEILEQAGTEESLNEAIDLLEELRNVIDTTRSKYWERRLVRATRKLDALVDGPASKVAGKA